MADGQANRAGPDDQDVAKVVPASAEPHEGVAHDDPRRERNSPLGREEEHEVGTADIGQPQDEEQAEVAELLPYEDDTAGGLMTTEFVTLPRELTVGEALARLREMAETPNMIYYLYVVEAEGSWQLAGVIALRSLILADPQVPLDQVMRCEFQKAHPDEPAKEVAQRIAEYNLLALPVVDESGDILGIITVDDAMEILLPKDWRQRLPRLFG